MATGAGERPPLLSLHDGKPCPYCGDPMDPAKGRKPTRDHIKPKSRGGSLAGGNRAVVCERCNADKANKHLEGFLLRLLRSGDARAPIVAAFIINNREAVYE